MFLDFLSAPIWERLPTENFKTRTPSISFSLALGKFDALPRECIWMRTTLAFGVMMGVLSGTNVCMYVCVCIGQGSTTDKHDSRKHTLHPFVYSTDSPIICVKCSQARNRRSVSCWRKISLCAPLAF